MQNTIENNLIELINIPSESGSEEKIIHFLAQKLSPIFKTQKIPVSKGRFCLLATSGKNITRLLVAHIDTVKGQIPVKFDQKFVYGRGSCDNKGSAQAMIEAGTLALQNNLTDFGLLFTIGEETCFDGAIAAKEYFRKHKIQPKLIVVGEPTANKIVTAQKGILLLEIKTKGIEGHNSRKNIDSANHKLVRILNKILDFKLPNTIVNIGKIEGGTADNVSAKNAMAHILFRSSQKNIDKLLFSKMKNFDCLVKKLLEFGPIKTSFQNLPFNEVDYFTEMYFFNNCIVCGPGNIKDAHSQNEKVSRVQLRKAIKQYFSLLKN